MTVDVGKTATPSPKGMVYILKSDSWVEDGRPYCKLGATEKIRIGGVRRRVRSMQTSVRHRIDVHFAGKVDRDPKLVESEIHAHFAVEHCEDGGGTEFFDVTPETAEAHYRSLGIIDEATEPRGSVPLVGDFFEAWNEIREYQLGRISRYLNGKLLTSNQLEKEMRGMKKRGERVVTEYADDYKRYFRVITA